MERLKTGLRLVALFLLFWATGPGSLNATIWKIDMDEKVCMSEAIVLGVMDEPIEIRREPYRPAEDGRPREKVTYTAHLKVSEILWGSPHLRKLEIRSWTVKPNDYFLPATLYHPGSSRPVGERVIWYLRRSTDFSHWSVVYVTSWSPGQEADRISQTTELIQRNTLCLQTSTARFQDDGSVAIRLQLELRNPTNESLAFPGFEMRNQRLHSQVPILLERTGGIPIKPKNGGVTVDPTIPTATLNPGSRRYFGINYVLDGQTIGYLWNSSLRTTLEGKGSTNWVRRPLR